MKYTVKTDTNLKDFVLEVYKGISASKAKKILKHNHFILNGKRIKHPETPLKNGMTLEIISIPKESLQIDAPNRKLRPKILFFDKHIVVAVKPAGMLSSGDLSERSPSLHTLLRDYLDEKNETNSLFVIHRLDKEVSGILIFARNEKLQQQFKEEWRYVSKKYFALVEGIPQKKEGTIKNWLKEGPKQKMFAYESEIEESKFAQSEYRVIKIVNNNALVEVNLITGRKNQIRVHMAGLGNPIVGDWKYGADATVKRQIRLLGYSLSFTHPITQKEMKFEIPIPNYFTKPSSTEDEKYK